MPKKSGFFAVPSGLGKVTVQVDFNCRIFGGIMNLDNVLLYPFGGIALIRRFMHKFVCKFLGAGLHLNNDDPPCFLGRLLKSTKSVKFYKHVKVAETLMK